MTHVVDAGKNVFETTALNRFHHFAANMPISSVGQIQNMEVSKKKGYPKIIQDFIHCIIGFSINHPAVGDPPGIPSHLQRLSGGACSSSASFQPLWTAASSATFRDTRSNCSPERQRTWSRVAEIIHGCQLVIWEVITL